MNPFEQKVTRQRISWKDSSAATHFRPCTFEKQKVFSCAEDAKDYVREKLTSSSGNQKEWLLNLEMEICKWPKQQQQSIRKTFHSTKFCLHERSHLFPLLSLGGMVGVSDFQVLLTEYTKRLHDDHLDQPMPFADISSLASSATSTTMTMTTFRQAMIAQMPAECGGSFQFRIAEEFVFHVLTHKWNKPEAVERVSLLEWCLLSAATHCSFRIFTLPARLNTSSSLHVPLPLERQLADQNKSIHFKLKELLFVDRSKICLPVPELWGKNPEVKCLDIVIARGGDTTNKIRWFLLLPAQLSQFPEKQDGTQNQGNTHQQFPQKQEPPTTTAHAEVMHRHPHNDQITQDQPKHEHP